jgi:RNA polymerase sigma-70 factor (ECF subfamily)
MTDDDDDIKQAYRQYFPLLVRKCTRMLRDRHEAEDLAQESFIRLHGSEVAHGDPRLVSAWLYRTSTRLCIDRLRARKRGPVSDEAASALVPGGIDPERRTGVQEAFGELLQRVPPEELEAAFLIRLDGLTQNEAAEVLGVHERTVRRLMSSFETRLERLAPRSER